MSATVLYIHGFLSSPESQKAQQTGQWLAQYRPAYQFVCPALSSYPDEAVAALKDIVLQRQEQPLYIIGSSLGGFWATWLIEQRLAQKAVLVNPAVKPQRLIIDRLGIPLKSYYTDQVYQLQPKHADFLEQHDSESLHEHERYWLMVQTGDNTLDYRHALDKYQRCRQTVEQGGSHTFEGYNNWLPQIIEFFEQVPREEKL